MTIHIRDGQFELTINHDPIAVEDPEAAGIVKHIRYVTRATLSGRRSDGTLIYGWLTEDETKTLYDSWSGKAARAMLDSLPDDRSRVL